MAQILMGSWDKGLAFDLHTLSSEYIGLDEYGHHRWDTTRSTMGELVYRLKYSGDKSVIPKIIELLERIGGVEKYDFIVPVPSSKTRAEQPVDLIAEALGKQRGVEVLKGFLVKKPGGPEQKGLDDPVERAKSLEGSIVIARRENIGGRSVLLLDDLYRSGSTLEVCAAMLTRDAKAAKVGVLTMTKTRSKS